MEQTQKKQNKYIVAFVQYLNYSIAYIKRKNIIKYCQKIITEFLKDYLTLYKKAKMAKFRVTYQQYQLTKMEKMIAKSNEHFFLNGRKINETR